MVVVRWLFLLGTLAASALAVPPKAPASKAKSPAPNTKFPNIILITLDTTRADRMGFLGSTRGLTPNLDALAKQSAIFTRAYAQVPLTPPSHASILTGTYPQFHQLNAMQTPLAEDLPYAPEILRAHGYSTAAILGSIVLEAKIPYAPGMDRGFQTYDANFRNGNPGEDRYITVQRRGDVVVSHVLAWLDKHPKRPFFLWVHFYDAHDPYDPPEPYKTRYASEPYDGGIAYEDASVGKLLRQLKARGLYDGAVLAVMADHGESLGAHGEDAHGFFLYDETIHVPLLIKLPNPSGAGNRIDNQVELVDVLPTLLQECGIEIPQEVQGESLLPLIKRGAAEANSTAQGWHEHLAYAQSEYGRDEYGWSDEKALRTGKYLYIQVPRRELYDRTADPKAEHNLAPTSGAVADTLAYQMVTFLQKTSNQHEAPKAVLDPGAQDALGALGYMASARDVAKQSPNDQSADPKDKIEIGNLVHRAQALQADMHYDEAIALLQQAIAKESGLTLYPMLGHWMMLKEDYANAVPVLRKALEFAPDSDVTRYQLGRALMALQEYEGAIPELEQLVARQPGMIKAHDFLEMAYARMNRLPEAIQESKTVLRYDPKDYESCMMLGYALPLTGDPQGAVEALKKAVSIQPKNPLPHVWLAGVYDQLGQKASADRERVEAKRLAVSEKPVSAPGPKSR